MTLLVASDSRVITLITDFGYKDPFVGQMKGVILKINPKVKIVDITHDITSYDIEEAAFVLWESFSYFPQGSIHLVVVDPQVGSKRRALAVKARGYYFVSPDNGVLTYILKNTHFKAVSIENEKYILRKDSPTFQGRDVFAPAAAWLSRGVFLEEFGSSVQEPILIDISESVRVQDRIIGKVVYIDKFGNAITNIKIKKEKIKYVKTGDLILPIVNCYSESPYNPAALVNSNGFVEIFNYKSTVQTLNLKKGQIVEVMLNG